MQELTRSQYAVQALDWLFARPTFKGTSFVNEAGIPPSSAKRILQLLAKDGVVTRIKGGSGRSAAILIFPALLNIAEGYSAF